MTSTNRMFIEILGRIKEIDKKLTKVIQDKCEHDIEHFSDFAYKCNKCGKYFYHKEV